MRRISAELLSSQQYLKVLAILKVKSRSSLGSSPDPELLDLVEPSIHASKLAAPFSANAGHPFPVMFGLQAGHGRLTCSGVASFPIVHYLRAAG